MNKASIDEWLKLTNNTKKNIFTEISKNTGIPSVAVEKDWWVVKTLEVVFSTKIAEHTVFKGGTSLSKAWGRISAFVGPNGAGKTTLFHVITGNLLPDSGTVKLNDKDITGLAPWKIARKQVGKLFQDVRVFENMSVLDNVRVALMCGKEQSILSAVRIRHNRELQQKHRDEAMHWLEFVGLEDQANNAGSELSFGQQKLLSIARLIAHGADCLLLDEPTAALSPAITKKMIELIQRLTEERNLSVALIEHNMNVVKELAFYIYFMHEGSVFCHGTQSCVLEDPEVRELYMGLTGNIDG